MVPLQGKGVLSDGLGSEQPWVPTRDWRMSQACETLWVLGAKNIIVNYLDRVHSCLLVIRFVSPQVSEAVHRPGEVKRHHVAEKCLTQHRMLPGLAPREPRNKAWDHPAAHHFEKYEESVEINTFVCDSLSNGDEIECLNRMWVT